MYRSVVIVSTFGQLVSQLPFCTHPPIHHLACGLIAATTDTLHMQAFIMFGRLFALQIIPVDPSPAADTTAQGARDSGTTKVPPCRPTRA